MGRVGFVVLQQPCKPGAQECRQNEVFVQGLRRRFEGSLAAPWVASNHDIDQTMEVVVDGSEVSLKDQGLAGVRRKVTPAPFLLEPVWSGKALAKMGRGELT